MTLAGLLQGVAVVLALEGMVYAIAPGVMRRALARMAETPEATLRVGGLAAALAAVGIAWALQGG